MFNNIIFVGGIHGSGKTTFAKKLSEHFSYEYLSASELIKWHDLNTDKQNKKVDNISGTQNLLIDALKAKIKPDAKYILDGHYCLLDSKGIPTKVPIDTFKAINPVKLFVISANPAEVKDRLESRDNKKYNIETVTAFQEMELEYAAGIALITGKSLQIIDLQSELNFEDFRF